jgi:hypothetical protein
MADYNFITIWKLNAPLEQVYREIEKANDWPQWWKGVVLVKELQKGDADGVGSVRTFTFKAALPYTLSFDSRVIAVEKMKRIEGHAFGELDGVGIWYFSSENGHTRVQYDWTVKTTKWWMNVMAPIARPAFEWNHNVIMKWGGEGLAKRLGCELLSA